MNLPRSQKRAKSSSAAAAPAESRRSSRPNARRSRPAPARPPGQPLLAKIGTRLRAAVERRSRVLGVAWRALVVVAVALGAVATGRIVERHVRSAKAFATASIEVEGAARLEHDEVMRAAGLALGQNVFEVSPEEARARLLQHAWVASAEVKRKLPASYRIQIVERQPVALLALDALYLVAEDGTAFKKVEEGDPVDLPVITGLDKVGAGSDRALSNSVLLSAVALLHDYREVGLFRREPIAEIHVEPDAGLSLYVGDDAMHVRLGARPYRQKLRRLRGVLDRLEKRHDDASYVYLDNQRRPDRVTVRLR
jgi:cell division protein FtsQ